MGNRRSFLLYPPSLIYGLITAIRNYLYNSGILISHRFSVPIICLGNITVGGTGKTPHTEYLIDLLGKEFRIAVLSRGYKRKSRGYQIASAASSVKDIGDESLQLYRKFPDILVAVDNDRVHGVRKLLQENPDIDLVILDDGFQHRSIKPGLSIILSDYNQPMQQDYLLPYGNLRESISNVRRADLIIITKSPLEIREEIHQEITGKLNALSVKNIFFTGLSYKEPVPLFENIGTKTLDYNDKNLGKKGVVLLTGIASPGPFIKFIEKSFSEIIHLKFPDHHYFIEKDIQKITDAWHRLKSPARFVITTEKDSVRLIEFTGIEDFIKESFYYIPVSIDFLDKGKKEFDKLIIDYVRKNK